MGTIKQVIMDHAMEINEGAQAKNVEFKKHRAELELKVIVLTAQIDSYSSFHDRLLELGNLLGGALICPECWIRNSRQSILDDSNKCSVCQFHAVDS